MYSLGLLGEGGEERGTGKIYDKTPLATFFSKPKF